MFDRVLEHFRERDLQGVIAGDRGGLGELPSLERRLGIRVPRSLELGFEDRDRIHRSEPIGVVKRFCDPADVRDSTCGLAGSSCYHLAVVLTVGVGMLVGEGSVSADNAERLSR